MSRSPRATGGVALLAAGLVCLAAAATASAAPGDLPRLKAGVPAHVQATFFDDHSRGGDGHLSWSAPGAPSSNNLGTSDDEDQEIRIQSTITDAGPGALELCSYAAGHPAGWMGTYQITPGALGGGCPAQAPATPTVGFARYVIGGHDPTHAFNRWHQMDLERFAMVPLDHRSAPTVWDSAWGACMDLGGTDPSCPTDAATPTLDTGIAPGATKILQGTDVHAAPDEQIIPISPALDAKLPDGEYQLVDIVNPYGRIAEAGAVTGSVSCTNFRFRTRKDKGFEGILAATPAGTPRTCQLPTSLPPAVAQGGRDPMAGSFADTCAVGPNGHCWTTPPHGVPNLRPAKTNATGTPTHTSTMTVAQGAAVSASTARRRMTATRARSLTRAALREAFGRGLTGERSSCRVAGTTRSTCTVSWHQHGASDSGKLSLRFRTVSTRLRWQFRVDAARQGARSLHVRHGYRTGGSA